MKIKKVMPIFVSLVMAGGVLAGCAHSHVYNSEYTSAGSSGHYHTASCHPDEHDAAIPHRYDDDNDTTCNDCDYVRTVSTTPENPNPENPAPENPTPETPTETSTPLPADKKIYVVGDSTVCSFNDPYFLPRYGYGTQLVEYLNATSDQIVNLALSGRSSKDFLTEGNYTTLKNSIAEGDYLIIGFGHNDEKSDDATRYTSPVGDHTTSGSFQKSLYDNYVKLANDKGATPILCTPVTRYDASGNYTGSKVHVTAAGDYVQAIKNLGVATDTTVIDLTALTIAEYKKDNAAAIYYHAHTTRKGDAGVTTGTEDPDGRDDTHLNKFGAKMVAYQFANALKSTDSTLKSHIKDNIVVPTKANDYASAVNMGYVKPDYKSFDPSNTTATKLNNDGWYATAMGKCGGDKITSLTATFADDKFTVGDTGDTRGSKFESGQDGFAAAFMQIDVSKNFRASVKATLKSVSSSLGATDKQAGFGMMLRDDILVNTNDDTLSSNFVAGGVLRNRSNIFNRFNKTLSDNKKISDALVKPEVGTIYDITIERTGQIITVSVNGNSNSVEFKEDMMDIFARDNEYMYLCLFANRGIVAEFTNLNFEITGDSQGA